MRSITGGFADLGLKAHVDIGLVDASIRGLADSMIGPSLDVIEASVRGLIDSYGLQEPSTELALLDMGPNADARLRDIWLEQLLLLWDRVDTKWNRAIAIGIGYATLYYWLKYAHGHATVFGVLELDSPAAVFVPVVLAFLFMVGRQNKS